MTAETRPMHSLATALTESLKAIDDDYREELREIRQLLEEARKEAEKDEPNSVKLKAILADCKGMFRTFAALDPMWQGIQRIARMVGID
ncbi:MAG: hypothetical protein U1E60_13090 [Reyranellaceae bacterium]